MLSVLDFKLYIMTPVQQSFIDHKIIREKVNKIVKELFPQYKAVCNATYKKLRECYDIKITCYPDGNIYVPITHVYVLHKNEIIYKTRVAPEGYAYFSGKFYRNARNEALIYACRFVIDELGV